MKNIQNNLRLYRKQKGLTQLQVAQELGFKSTDRISKWEKGTMYPHLVNFLKLLKIYGAQPHDLYSE